MNFYPDPLGRGYVADFYLPNGTIFRELRAHDQLTYPEYSIAVPQPPQRSFLAEAIAVLGALFSLLR
jgi:hypothetical protein